MTGISDIVAASNSALAVGGASGQSEAVVAKTKTATDKDTFLKLLVAQLKYQDPSKPVDSSEFLSQTAQFSALEAMQDVSTNSGATLAAQLRLNASGLVGQTVSYTGADGKAVTGQATSASFGSSSIAGTGNEPVIKVDGKDVLLSAITSVGVTGGATTGTTPAGGTPASSTPKS